MSAAVVDRQLSSRLLPVLDVIAPTPPTGRGPVAPEDDRLEEYRPETRALPRFHVWTRGSQTNRSDSEEMAGPPPAAGCAESPSLDEASLIVINTCAIREAAEQK